MENHQRLVSFGIFLIHTNIFMSMNRIRNEKWWCCDMLCRRKWPLTSFYFLLMVIYWMKLENKWDKGTEHDFWIFTYISIWIIYIYTYILKTLCYIYFYIVLLYNSSYKWSLFFYFKYFRATALDFVRVVNLKKLFYYICVFCSWISDTEIYKSVWKRFDTILWYYFILLSIV